MHRAEWWHEKSWHQNCSSNMASTWGRVIKWTILTTKLFFKHGINMEQNDKMNNLDNKTIVQTWDGIHLVVGLQLLSSCLEPVEKFLKLSSFREKYFWNHHYKKSHFEISIIPHLPKRERPSVSEEWMKTSWRYLKCCSSSTQTSAYIIYLIVWNGINMIYNM